MTNRFQNPASYDYRLQGFSLKELNQSQNNGISVYGYSDPNIEISYLELIFSTGKLNDKNKAIPAVLTRLFPYLETADKQTLFELLEFYGAQLSYESSSTHSSIKVYALSSDFQLILNKVTEAIAYPNWKESNLKHCQNTLIKDLHTRKLEKKTISDKTFNTHFYQGTNLANSLSIANISALTAGDITTKIKELFGQLDFILTVNIPADSLDLSSFTANNKRAIIPCQFPNKTVVSYPKLDTEQSLIRSVTPLCSVYSEAYPLYYFYNQILGGSFQSILSQEIREKQGLTYGIHSSLLSINSDAYLNISSTTPYKKGALVLSKIDEITDDFGSYLNEEYLDQIKKIASASFLKNMENTFSQLALQKNILLSKLDANFYSSLLDGLKEVTIADLLRVNDELKKRKRLQVIIE